MVREIFTLYLNHRVAVRESPPRRTVAVGWRNPIGGRTGGRRAARPFTKNQVNHLLANPDLHRPRAIRRRDLPGRAPGHHRRADLPACPGCDGPQRPDQRDAGQEPLRLPPERTRPLHGLQRAAGPVGFPEGLEGLPLLRLRRRHEEGLPDVSLPADQRPAPRRHRRPADPRHRPGPRAAARDGAAGAGNPRSETPRPRERTEAPQAAPGERSEARSARSWTLSPRANTARRWARGSPTSRSRPGRSSGGSRRSCRSWRRSTPAPSTRPTWRRRSPYSTRSGTCLYPVEQARVIHLLVDRIEHDPVAGKLAVTFAPSGIQALAGEVDGAKEAACASS